jgi:hypothetical protein
MQRHTVYLYLETALHVSGGTTTRHQERKQLYLQHLVFVTPLLLSAAISFTVVYPLLHTLTTEHLKTPFLQKLEFKSEETLTVNLSTKF